MARYRNRRPVGAGSSGASLDCKVVPATGIEPSPAVRRNRSRHNTAVVNFGLHWSQPAAGVCSRDGHLARRLRTGRSGPVHGRSTRPEGQVMAGPRRPGEGHYRAHGIDHYNRGVRPGHCPSSPPEAEVAVRGVRTRSRPDSDRAVAAVRHRHGRSIRIPICESPGWEWRCVDVWRRR